MTEPHIRTIYGDKVQTTYERLDAGPIAVKVAGFGHVIVGEHPEHGMSALIAQGPGTKPHARTVTAITRDGEDWYEIEMLPNVSGEDRIVVCVPKAIFD